MHHKIYCKESHKTAGIFITNYLSFTVTVGYYTEKTKAVL